MQLVYRGRVLNGLPIEEMFKVAISEFYEGKEVPPLDYEFFKRIYYMAFRDSCCMHFCLYNEIDTEIRAYFQNETDAERRYKKDPDE